MSRDFGGVAGADNEGDDNDTMGWALHPRRNDMSQRVGVIGGGQLARMMIPAATNLGLEFSVLAESDESSARLAATTVGDYSDVATVLAFARE